VMNRKELGKLLFERWNKGLSVQLCALPSWGVTRFINNLEVDGRKIVKLDANLQPFKIPEVEVLKGLKPVTIVIDHFETLLETGNKELFNHLRSIRDQRKYELTYMIVTSKKCDLTVFAQLLASFYELATETVVNFPALDNRGMEEAIEEYENRLGIKLGKSEQQEIKEFAGGIPALIKTWILEGSEAVRDSERLKGIVERIWSALSESQREQLIEIASGQAVEVNKALVEWGVVEKNIKDQNLNIKNEEKKYMIRSEALEEFVRKHAIGSDEGKKKDDIDVKSLEGKLENQLTKIEFRLFRALKDNIGEVCTRDQMVDAGWPEDNAEGVSDEALDQAVSRLRKKLEGNNYELRTVRGRGYLLEISNTK